MENGKFEMHCVVELFGHSQIAGRVTEQSIGGATFIRVDVPKTSKRDPFTSFTGQEPSTPLRPSKSPSPLRWPRG